MTKYFPFSFRPVEVETAIGVSYRSHSLHKGIVKHCFESKFIGKEPSYHIGFSPQNNVRIMVTFLRSNENQTTLYQHISNGTEKYFAINYNDPVKTGETHLVCLDTENQTIMSVQGSKILTAKYHSFPVEELEWFAFFDGARNTINQSSRVSINLGFTDFINKIPEGFQPWIYGIDELRDVKKKIISLQCFHGISHYIFIYITMVS